MQKQNQGKSFAFKLAEKQEPAPTAEQWKVRDGVALAGCSGPNKLGNWRDYDWTWNRIDQGIYC